MWCSNVKHYSSPQIFRWKHKVLFIWYLCLLTINVSCTFGPRPCFCSCFSNSCCEGKHARPRVRAVLWLTTSPRERAFTTAHNISHDVMNWCINIITILCHLQDTNLITKWQCLAHRCYLLLQDQGEVIPVTVFIFWVYHNFLYTKISFTSSKQVKHS